MCQNFHLFFRLNNILWCIYCFLFIHSSADAHWGCFHHLAPVNKTAVNVAKQISLWDPAFTYFGYTLRNGVAVSYGNSRASLVAQWQRTCLPMQETWVQSLVWEDPLEKEMETHSSILSWKIPQTEEPGRLPSKGSQKSRLWLSDSTTTMVILCLTFWETAILFSIAAVPFYISTKSAHGSNFSTSLPTLVIFVKVAILMDVVVLPSSQRVWGKYACVNNLSGMLTCC